MGSDVEQRECSCSVLAFQVTDSSQLCARFAVRLLLLLHIPTSGPDPRLGIRGGVVTAWLHPGAQSPALGLRVLPMAWNFGQWEESWGRCRDAVPVVCPHCFSQVVPRVCSSPAPGGDCSAVLCAVFSETAGDVVCVKLALPC